MGMLISILKDSRLAVDCTLGGESSYAKGLCLTNVEGPFSPSEDYPAAQLIVKDFGPMIGKSLRIVPESKLEKWHMAGGNFGYTSDSRFGEACKKLIGHSYGAVMIFDRVES
jgi:hypothetical protein